MTSGGGISRGARRAWSVLAALSLSVASTLGPLVPVPTAYGQTNSAVSLNGTTAYVQTTDSPSLRISSNLTIKAWAKPTAVVPGLSGVVDKPGYDLSPQPIDNGFAAVLRLTLGGKAYGATTVNAGPLALGQWYHLAGTFDGQVLRVWVSGRELASLAQVGSIDPSPAPLRIGILDGSSIHFAGEIDEVRVSDTVRCTTNFKPTATPFTADTNTRVLWHLDEGSGTTTADRLDQWQQRQFRWRHGMGDRFTRRRPDRRAGQPHTRAVRLTGELRRDVRLRVERSARCVPRDVAQRQARQAADMRRRRHDHAW